MANFEDPFSNYPKFEEYAGKYPNIAMERDGDGILTMTLHSDGGSIVYGSTIKPQLLDAFYQVASDRENEVVILTGAGEAFMGYRNTTESVDWANDPEGWYIVYQNTKRMLQNLLDIDVPVIAAVNGPARVHAEIAVMCDIVLAADTALFQDMAHFVVGAVPGDGVHVVWPLVLGANRARYFLLTGQEIGAQEALRLGIVNEVLSPDGLLLRAGELARKLRQQPRITRRYTRICFTQPLKKAVLEELSHGLALEGQSWAGSGWTQGHREIWNRLAPDATAQGKGT